MKIEQKKEYPLFLTPEMAGKISGLGVNRIRDLMKAGMLEYLPVGSSHKVTTVQALLDYYERAKVPAKQF